MNIDSDECSDTDEEVEFDEDEETDLDEECNVLTIDTLLEDTIYNDKTNFPCIITSTKHTPTVISFSPTEDIFGIGDVNGNIDLFSVSENNTVHLSTVECFLENSVADFTFSRDGKTVFATSKNEGLYLIDVSSKSFYNFLNLNNENGLTTIKEANPTTLCTGDDKGFISLYDIRQLKPCMNLDSFKRGSDESNDYISSILFKNDKKLLAVGSGAGVLTTFDVRSMGIVYQNCKPRLDITSLCTTVDEKILIGATLTGELIYSPWTEIMYYSSQSYKPKRKMSCNEVVCAGEQLIVSLWDDGLIRIHQILPHKFLGYIGEATSATECMAISNDKSWLSTIGFEHKIFTYNVSNLSSFSSNSLEQSALTEQKLERKMFFQDLQ